MWHWYTSKLATHPLLTKASTSAILMSISDILCQQVETSSYKNIIRTHGSDVNLQAGCPTNVKHCPKRAKTDNQSMIHYDMSRTAQVAITGWTFSGPISHLWYQILEKMVTIRHVAGGIAIRMLLDAILFSPIAVGGYFVWRSVLEGKSMSETQTKLESKWYSALQASWSFWPAANIINFGLVPVQFRVLYNNGLSVLWNGYLSNVNNQRLEKVVDERQKHPEYFVSGHENEEELSIAEHQAHSTVCVCSHCRPVRA